MEGKRKTMVFLSLLFFVLSTLIYRTDICCMFNAARYYGWPSSFIVVNKTTEFLDEAKKVETENIVYLVKNGWKINFTASKMGRFGISSLATFNLITNYLFYLLIAFLIINRKILRLLKYIMNKKSGVIIIIILILVGLGFMSLNKKQKTTVPSQVATEKKEQNFLLEGYPIEKVPLFKLTKVSSNKIIINTDPKNTSNFDEINFAYFNVVFETDATQKEFFDYYRGLFESLIADESEVREMVKGKIGEYKVSAAYYGENKIGYIQVHLPNYQDESLNKYFTDFPEIISMNPTLIEHEKKYGLLNQKGGEIEFSKYFTVIDSGDQNNDGKDDVDEFLVLETEYKNKFQDKPEYTFEEKSGTMKWQDGEYESTLVVSRDHGRIYLNLRKGMEK